MKWINSLLHLTVAYAVASAVYLPASAQPKDPKKDPEQIGNRDVGSGINFYSLEKEIALGKQLAQEVEREANWHAAIETIPRAG